MKVDEDFVKEWMQRLDLGVKYRNKCSDYEKWHEYRNYYRGNWPDTVKVPVNRIFSFIKGMVPRVYFRTPSISVTPTRPELAAHARMVEAIDNWIIRETRLKKYVKKSILDASLCGTGVIKLGYDSEYGFFDSLIVDKDSGTVSQVGVDSGERIEYNSNIAPGMPWGLRVLPDNIITPYGYSDPDDFPWIAHMFLRPLEDVKQDQKYDPKTRKQIKGGFSFIRSEQKTFTALRELNQQDFALLYEVHDVKTNKVMVFCEDKCLLYEDDTSQVDGLPFEFIIFNDDSEHFWGISDVKLLLPQQIELNEIRTQAHYLRKQDLLKFLYGKGSLKPEALETFLDSDPETIGMGIEMDTEYAKDAVIPFQPRNLTDGLIREQAQTENDMRSTLGYGINQSGEYVPFHNKTAAEATIVNQANEIRSDERRDIVADCMERIIRKFNQYIFKYWDAERVVEIAGADGAQYWIKYTGEQLRGEYNLVVNPESGQPVSRALKQQVAQTIFGALRDDPLIDQVLLRRVMLQQTDLIDPVYQTLVKPQEQIEAEQQQQMQAAGPQQLNFEDVINDASLRSRVFGV